MTTQAPSILVLGDIHIDCLLLPAPPDMRGNLYKNSRRNGHYLELRRPGGAWLLKEIIRHALDEPSYAASFRPPVVVNTYAPPTENIAISLPDQYLRFVTLLKLFPQATVDDKEAVYRIDRPLGWINRVVKNNSDPCALDLRTRLIELSGAPLPDGPFDLLVLHDIDGHFREQNVTLLEGVLKQQLNQANGWIVWHMYSPLAEGHLWDVAHRNKEWLDRTIIVVNIECLRQAGMQLPQVVSLEHESAVFQKGMQTIERLRQLADAKIIVAHQHREGVLLYHREGGLKSSCYYCPYLVGDSLPRGGGAMIGYSSILVAAIVRGLAFYIRNGKEALIEAVAPAIKQGIVLDHIHYLDGFGKAGDLTNFLDNMAYPYARLFLTLAELNEAKEKWKANGRSYFVTAVPIDAVKDRDDWSRIDGFVQRRFNEMQKLGTHSSNGEPLNLDNCGTDIACDIVIKGLRAVVEDESLTVDDSLPNTPGSRVQCPYHVYGKIATAYRKEIDGFANIHRVMEKYLSDDKWAIPLSIAVFGQPGSGKSFAVTQILHNIDPEIAKRPLVFNLSQMGQPEKDLEIAFHKVQDAAATGVVPLVVFDEFDVEECQWLKHFLAPMQDGQYKAGESTYRIGRAMFVFTGGTAKTWQDFYEKAKSDYEDGKSNKFVERKIADFVSRLRGYLEVQSINPPDSEPKVDNVLKVRRAILLRSLVEKNLPDVIDESTKEAWIDRDVARHLLLIPRYEHEVRSMEAILQMSRVSPRGTLHWASLPTEHQIKMHTRSMPDEVAAAKGGATGN